MKPISLLFILLVAVFATLVKYELGESDQLPQIPLIIKEIQADFLSNDAFITANQTFGPRFYYSKFMAFGSQIFSLPVWFLMLSLICCYFTAYFTALSARLIANSESVGILAAIFVIALPTPTLAESTFTNYEHLMSPTALVFPILIAAFYYFLKRQRLIFPLLLAGIASLFQVLYGLTASLLILFAYFGTHFKVGWKDFNFIKTIIALLILGVFAAANLYPYFTNTVSSTLTTQQFVEIVAYFRNPHHYVPSYFPLIAWVLSLLFFGSASWAFYHFYKKDSTSPIHFQVILMAFAILASFLMGYVFVEIFPHRLVTTAQTFRYVALLKWFSILYLAAYLAQINWKLFAAAHPVSLAVLTIFNQNIQRFSLPIFVILTVASLALIRIEEDIQVLRFLFLILIFLLYANWNKQLTIWILGIATLGLAVSPFISQTFLPSNINQQLAKVYPKYNYAYQSNDNLLELSNYIKNKTPQDAIFITPPDLSQLRFSAHRAIVVDFKSFPYQDEFMLDWRERIEFCYGTTDKQGFEAKEDLKEKFQAVSLPHLKNIKTKYQASYAVVDSKNPITQQIIFENDDYKLIRIE